MLWIVRLIASTGLLGLVAAWPASAAGAVTLAMVVCAVGAAMALAVRAPAVWSSFAARPAPRTQPLSR